MVSRLLDDVAWCMSILEGRKLGVYTMLVAYRMSSW